MPQKKVLLITFEFPPYLGGAGVYAHDTAIGLSKNNCKVDVLTYQHAGIEKIQSRFKDTYGITIRTFKPISGLHFVQFPNQMRKVLKKTDYDLVILNDNRAKNAIALFNYFLKLDYDKVVSVFHGFELGAYFDSPSFPIKLLGINKRLLKILNKIKTIVAISKDEKQMWDHRFPDLRHKTKIVYHGVCEDIFYKRTPQEVSSLKRQHTIPLDKRIILSASRLVDRKCQDVVIKAFNEIHKDHEDVMLYIAGDGPLKKTLETMANSLEISDKIVFLGSLDREQLSAYYAMSYLFALTSKFEPFGLVYLEAAACGLPLISGNNGGVTDVVFNDINGYCIDPENVEELNVKLKQLLEDEALYTRLATTAHQLYKDNYTCQQSALRLLQACEMHDNQEAAVCY